MAPLQAGTASQTEPAPVQQLAEVEAVLLPPRSWQSENVIWIGATRAGERVGGAGRWKQSSRLEELGLKETGLEELGLKETGLEQLSRERLPKGEAGALACLLLALAIRRALLEAGGGDTVTAVGSGLLARLTRALLPVIEKGRNEEPDERRGHLFINASEEPGGLSRVASVSDEGTVLLLGPQEDLANINFYPDIHRRSLALVVRDPLADVASSTGELAGVAPEELKVIETAARSISRDLSTVELAEIGAASTDFATSDFASTDIPESGVATSDVAASDGAVSDVASTDVAASEGSEDRNGNEWLLVTL